MSGHLQGVLGILLIPALVWALSSCRAATSLPRLLRLVAATLAVQTLFAVALLKIPAAEAAFNALSGAVSAVQHATDTGTRLVFGYLAGGPPPFEPKSPQNSFVLAFAILPMIVVISALMRLLYHWGLLQRVVAGFAFLLRRGLGIGGPLATAASATMFLGPVEAPLMIRPYLRDMGKGALFAMMVAGMSTVAGTVMALYASILAPHVPGAAGHLMAGSLMNVPGALLLARLYLPQGFDSAAAPGEFLIDVGTRSGMDAVATGTVEGLEIAARVAAMLIVMVALVALADAILAAAAAPFGSAPTIGGILGTLFRPLAWLIGIPWSETGTAGTLLGKKFVLNEFLAYLDLAQLPASGISERTRLILTYALCSFANLGSLGILIGGLTAMVPERRGEIAELAPKAVVLGFLATLMSAAVVGLVA